jgi:hypothetical protein
VRCHSIHDVYMLGGASVFFLCLHVQALWPHLFAEFDFNALPPGHVYGGPQGGSQNTNLCLCSTVGYSLYSACAACQRKNGLRAAALCPLLNCWWLTYMSIAGQNGRPTVQRPCLPDREFLVASGHLLRLTLKLVRRYPNPVPPGTLVPHWALLDVRARYPSFPSVALQSRHTLG